MPPSGAPEKRVEGPDVRELAARRGGRFFSSLSLSHLRSPPPPRPGPGGRQNGADAEHGWVLKRPEKTEQRSKRVCVGGAKGAGPEFCGLNNKKAA